MDLTNVTNLARENVLDLIEDYHHNEIILVCGLKGIGKKRCVSVLFDLLEIKANLKDSNLFLNDTISVRKSLIVENNNNDFTLVLFIVDDKILMDHKQSDHLRDGLDTCRRFQKPFVVWILNKEKIYNEVLERCIVEKLREDFRVKRKDTFYVKTDDSIQRGIHAYVLLEAFRYLVEKIKKRR